MRQLFHRSSLVALAALAIGDLACNSSGSGPGDNGGAGGNVEGGGGPGGGGSPAAKAGSGGGGSSASGGSPGMGASGRGGSAGSAGGTGGSATGGAAGGTSGGASGSGTGGARDGGVPDGGADAARDTAPMASSCMPTFSFFVTSMQAMTQLSGSAKGFGGDLRFGAATGLEGADKICQTIATRVGAGDKTWKAFLSATAGGPNGAAVNAIDRVGAGPWFDCRGRSIAMNKAGLVAGNRPMGDMVAVNDLADETGQGIKRLGDSHDTLTGSTAKGLLDPMRATCADWTSTTAAGMPQIGHAWPRSANSGLNWIADHRVGGCLPGINLVSAGGPAAGDRTVGGGGGYGAFYCFALTM